MRFLAICALVFAVSLTIVLLKFDEAFPEASIEFDVDRRESESVARDLLARLRIPQGARHAAEFSWDDQAKIFLERSVSEGERERLLDGEVELWFWRHRWFTPLSVEEVQVDIAPSGELVGFQRVIEESAPRSPLGGDGEAAARALIRSFGMGDEGWELASTATRQLPNRVDTTLTFESKSIRPAEGRYRIRVTFHGDQPGGFRQELDVPESWIRQYRELRSKNQAAGAVDTLFMALTVLAALVVFIARMRRGDVRIAPTLATGAVGAVLVGLTALNSFPSAMAGYDTDTSWAAFLTQQAVFAVVQGVGLGVMLMVLVGAGEPLYRERLPGQLSWEGVFRWKALRSRRLMSALVLGYTLVPAFMAYQVLFYLGARSFGAWSPADIPYDDILSSAIPWASVLFMGFFPAVSEEFLSRAFSLPFLERVLRSRWTAIVVAGFIWGFGHAAYPNQPFFIRGVEVGLAGIVAGWIFYRWGLIPLLVWHYTIDAVYTALLLFRSGNAYYVVSAGVASLGFLAPLAIGAILRLRSGRFEDDDDLTNAALGTAPPLPHPPPRPLPPLPPLIPLRPLLAGSALLVAAAATTLWLAAGPLPSDAVRYRIGKAEALRAAERHLASTGDDPASRNSVVLTSAGFRRWVDHDREDGGGPGPYAAAAAEEIVEKGGIKRLLEAQRQRVEAATWVARFFTPLRKEEIYVEVDGVSGAPVGRHLMLEETAPGASPAREDAVRSGEAELRRYGLDPARFELKEALPFRQPKRLDWLLHFEETAPVVDGVVRRASVRVSGGRVTQFAKTVKVPEPVERDRQKQTVVQTAILVLQIGAALVILSLIGAGFVAGARHHGFAWRPAAKWALVAAPLALASSATSIPLLAGGYDTSVAWTTWLVTSGTFLTVGIFAQLGAAFIALLLIFCCAPGWAGAVSREGFARCGRHAAAASLLAVSLLALLALAEEGLPVWLPAWFELPRLAVAGLIERPLPLVPALWRALLSALLIAGAAASVSMLARAEASKRRLVEIGLVASAALLMIDPSSRIRETAGSAVFALVAVALLWAVARFALGGNPLAWALAPLAAGLLAAGATLTGVGATPVAAQGWVLVAVAAAVLLASAIAPRRDPSS